MMYRDKIEDVSTGTLLRELERREQLLEAASEKPARKFTQFDYWPQDEQWPNEPCGVMYCSVEELRNTNCLRLYVPDDMTKQDALKALKQIRKTLKPDDFTLPKGVMMDGDEDIPF
jgi:hypothetical protein